MLFPDYRPRRMRRNENFRALIRETQLAPDQFVYPLFVVPGRKIKKEIPSMPGCFQLSIDQLKAELKEIKEVGLKAVLLFGIPEKKDEIASRAYAKDGIVQRAIAEIKSLDKDLLVITDVCLCEYTSHGHCGFVSGGEIDNDATLEILGRVALSHARAGADMVAPSDMMDGRVAEIRETLDEDGLEHIPIMSYAVKYASSFYGPFREAAECAPQFGDRRSYQMDPANSREALREATLDMEEGADILMVKPALPYLDIISRLREEFDHPIAAYQVSGEYAMVKAAAKMGWLDEERVMMECLLSIRRAGADIIITYYAKDAARLLRR
ncbi:MAG TPA: porphobilinogen synthase [Proteobacteria bacterium]|nr:porphobilinogen synthase [Pseudomonadota bacterium]